MPRFFKITFLAFAAALILVPSFSLAGEGDESFTKPTNEAIQKEVSEINASIKAKRAKWVAGETSMSKLSPAEHKMRLGISDVPILREQRTPAPNLLLSISGKEATTSASLSGTFYNISTLDWRNYHGGSFVTGIRDQSSCGGCWAFGSTAALESYTLITNNTPISTANPDLDLSEQVVLSCSGNGNCNGGYLVTDFFVNTGTPLESCDPYIAAEGNCSNACANWQQSAYKTTNYSWIVPYGAQQTVTTLKAGLYLYGPLVVTFAVYNDFYLLYVWDLHPYYG